MTGERLEEATRSFLADHPDLEDGLETLLEREHEAGSWTFDDAPLDSGRFGELVSREFVEKTDDGDYRFVDRGAVETALSGEPTAPTSTATDAPVDVSLPDVEGTALGALAGALVLVAAVRLLYYSSVFRGEQVVSPANDPYFYRYWQERLLDQSTGLGDVGMLSAVGEQTTVRPLTHTLNWWFAELLGGSPGAAETVAAWQPVVATLLAAVVLYGLVVTLTADRRVALASLLFLAVTPVHAVYTSLGFLEHRAYQYLWLTLLAFALVWLAVDLTRRARDADPRAAALAHVRHPRTWAVVAVLALAVAASAHTWGGSPLTFVPVALYLALRVAADVRSGVPPLLANAPALVGLGAGSLLAVVAHVRFAWHEPVAAAAPVLVTAGGVAVAVLATAWARFELPPAGLVATEGVLAAVGLVLFGQLRPDDVARLRERADDLFGREEAIEATSLFAVDQGVVLGPLAQIGFGFYLGLAVLALVTWLAARRYEPGWFVLVSFGWVYLLLAAVQSRFAAHLSVFLAVFAGVALVFLIGVLGLGRKPTLFGTDTGRIRPITVPEPRIGGYLLAVVGLVLLMNVVFVPTLLGQVQHSDDKVEATMVIADHVEATDDHPEFVLSQWGDNRLYNYFVSGEAQSYGYARATFEEFVTGQDPDRWYGEFDGRVGYVVLTDADAPADTTQHTLFEEFGAGNDSLAHYQLLYTAEEARAFVVVEGAVIRATAPPDGSVTARTDVVLADQSFTYERTGTADGNGTVAIRVAYPGEYDLGGDTVTVTEEDVYEGNEVTTTDRER